MDGTTAIKIDYYEELKAKADKYDEKETPINIIVTTTAPYDEECCDVVYSCPKCDFVVYNEFEYCNHCGKKLSWTDL